MGCPIWCPMLPRSICGTCWSAWRLRSASAGSCSRGGGVVCGSFFAAGLVDELSLLVAPALDGRVGHESFVAFGEAGLADKVQLSLQGCEALPGGLVHLRYTVAPR